MKHLGTPTALALCATALLIGLNLRDTGFGHFPPAVSLLVFGVTCILLSLVKLPRPSHSTAGTLTSEAVSPAASKVTVINSLRASRTSIAPPARITNAFTIDLEDYFHTEVASRTISPSQWPSMPSRLEATVPKLLDLMDRCDVRSTVFVLGAVARSHPALVKQISQRGHEIACHSDTHRAVFRLSPDQFYDDTLTAKNRIEDIVGKRVAGYRAPSFSIIPGCEWAFDVLSQLEFDYDSSVNPIHHKFYGNPNAPRFPHFIGNILEVPLATRRAAGKNLPVSGGAYLRLLPLTYIQGGLKSINVLEQRPFTLYVHPWEIDSHQVPMDLDWKSRVRQQGGTFTMEQKLESLFGSFNFAPMNQVYADLLPTPSVVMEVEVDAELEEVSSAA